MRLVDDCQEDLCRMPEVSRLNRLWSPEAALDLSKSAGNGRWDRIVDDYVKRLEKASEPTETD